MTGFRRKARLLSAEEIELWLAVARTVAARPGSALPHSEPRPLAAPAPAAPEPKAIAPAAKPTPPSRPAPPPLAPFEKRFRQKVTRGRVEIEAAIDLHGLTQGEAHSALHGFLRTQHGRGARLVLVVTGKGRGRGAYGPIGGDGEPGVLRRAVPHWLREPGLRSLVLGFEEAGLPHGGLGALYVRLRRHGPDRG